MITRLLTNHLISDLQNTNVGTRILVRIEIYQILTHFYALYTIIYPGEKSWFQIISTFEYDYLIIDKSFNL